MTPNPDPSGLLFTAFQQAGRGSWEEAALASLKGRSLESLERELFPGFTCPPILFPADASARPESQPGDDVCVSRGCPPLQELRLSDPGQLQAQAKSLQAIGQTLLPLSLDSLLEPGRTATDFAPWSRALASTGMSWELRAGGNWKQALAMLGATAGNFPLELDLAGINLTVGTPLALDSDREALGAALHGSERLRFLVSGYPFHAAGADPAFELATWLSLWLEQLRLFEQAGVDLPAGNDLLRHELAIGHDLFPELAKLRAARLLGARLLESLAIDPAKRRITLRARASQRSLTRLDPWNNLLRSTLQGVVAACAGLDGLHLTAPREGLGSPTEMENRIRENVHLVLRGESWLHEVADPGRGSMLVEHLTQRLAETAWTRFQQLEAGGGFLDQLNSGNLQQVIRAERTRMEQAFAHRKLVLVGVNQYADAAARLEESAVEPLQEQGRLALPPYRMAARLEGLRSRLQQSARRLGGRAGICMVCDGPLRQHKARLEFSRGFLASAGLSMCDTGAGLDEQATADGVVASGATVLVLCSSDERYPEWVPAILKAIAAKQPATRPLVLLAGHPQEGRDKLEVAGVQAFLHLRANQEALLEQIQAHLEAQS